MEEKTQTQVESEKIIKDAQMVAVDLLEKAHQTADRLIKAGEKQTTSSLIIALQEVFGEGVEKQRFIDVTRIPLICKSIYDIHDNIKEIKEGVKSIDGRFVNQDQFTPVKNIVYGLVVLVLTAVATAVVALVIKK